MSAPASGTGPPSPPTTPRASRGASTRDAALGQILPGAAVAAVVALALTALSGAETYARLGLPDPGVVVTYGLPVLRALTESAAVVTVGALLLAVVLAPPPSAGRLGVDGYRALQVATWTGVAWAAGAAVTAVLLIADAFGRPLSSVLTATVLSESLGGLPTTRAWVAGAVVALVVVALCRAALSWSTAAAGLAVALAGLLPIAFTGHSSAGGSHDVAVSSLVLHLLAASLWVGGLVAVLVHAAAGGAHVPIALRRFSALAGACWVVMAVSGVVNALIRVPPDDLLSGTYGLLLALKVVGLAVLGVLGGLHRARTLPAVASGSRAGLLRLGGVEVLIMFATLGVAVALGRTPPPDGPGALPTRMEALLGYTLDGPLTPAGLLTTARFDLLLGTAALVAAGVYLAGVRRLPTAWPVGRTAAWLGGCAVLLVATSSGIGTYATAQFSLHMVQQVAIGAVVPLLLAAGAPRRLAGRLVGRAGPDHPAGLREAVSALERSTVGRAVGSPTGATVLVVAVPWLVDGTGLFDDLVGSHPGHLTMVVSALVAGSVFVSAVLGDRAAAAGRTVPVVMVVVAVVSQALLGLRVLATDHLLGGGWYAQLGIGWVDRAADQELGALVLGAGGATAWLVLLGVVIARRPAREAPARGGSVAADPR